MKEHGIYRIIIHKRFLEINVTGSWNYDSIIHFIEDFKTSALEISDKPWGVLVDLRSWDLSVPDTEKPMNKLQNWCMKNNQRYEASIIDQNPVKRYQMDKYLKTIDSNVIIQKYFYSKENAYMWFKKIGLIK